MLFTAENAAEMQRRSREVLRQKPQLQALAQTDHYAAQSLARTRKQLNKLRDWLDVAERERNTKDADAITRSIERLAKLECYLSNRPGPGNYKPTAPHKSRDRAPIAPIGVPEPPQTTP
jgi:hypothetical protein